MSPDLIDSAAFAELLGVKASTFRGYHKIAQRRRRRGIDRSDDVPQPYDRIGGRPVWLSAAAHDFVAQRSRRRGRGERQD